MFFSCISQVLFNILIFFLFLKWLGNTLGSLFLYSSLLFYMSLHFYLFFYFNMNVGPSNISRPSTRNVGRGWVGFPTHGPPDRQNATGSDIFQGACTSDSFTISFNNIQS